MPRTKDTKKTFLLGSRECGMGMKVRVMIKTSTSVYNFSLKGVCKDVICWKGSWIRNQRIWVSKK